MRSRGVRRALALTVVASAACGGPARDVRLVVHSPLPEAVLDHAEEVFESDFPTVDVRIVRARPEETLAALRSGSAPVDVWWGAPGALLEVAADEGLLAAYRPPWLRQPGVGEPDPEGRWQVSQISPFVIAFNRERLPLSLAPEDWVDLFHFRWAGEIVLLDPDRSPEMASFMGAMIVEALRDDDDLLRGFDWLGRLDRAAGEYVPDAATALRRLESGGGLLTILPRDIVEEARHAGAAWLHYRLPESGTPMLLRGVAVGARAAEPDLARAFVDLTGTVDVATVARLHTRWMPGHGDVDVGRLPEDFEMDVPWVPFAPAPDTLARELDGWIERFDREVRGRR